MYIFVHSVSVKLLNLLIDTHSFDFLQVEFWMDVLLTFQGYIPGIIYDIYVLVGRHYCEFIFIILHYILGVACKQDRTVII